ncbi:hypothetical protein WMY93_032465 [Mugilogobius chulae]|uniref:Uncharacterized protein n=1 Tax=Mugilogobius chulae TaxID=88201 RepID=A0AAW0MVI8_9GOBI
MQTPHRKAPGGPGVEPAPVPAALTRMTVGCALLSGVNNASAHLRGSESSLGVSITGQDGAVAPLVLPEPPLCSVGSFRCLSLQQICVNANNNIPEYALLQRKHAQTWNVRKKISG